MKKKSPIKPKERTGARKATRRTRSASPSHAELARAAGVDRTMVTAFLSGNHYRRERKRGIGISGANRVKIKEACHRLNYTPDDPKVFFRLYPERAPIGLLLSTGIPEGFMSPYHSLIFEGFAKGAFENGVTSHNLFYPGGRDFLAEPELLPNLIRDGAIRKVAHIGGALNTSLIEALLREDVAVVIVGPAAGHPGTVSVVPDFFEAARQAIHALYDRGHRAISVVLEPYTGRDRYLGHLVRDGCLAAIHELGLDIREEDFIVAYPGEKDPVDPAVVQRLLGMKPAPTGIYCYSDPTARSLAMALALAGVTVPDDISIVAGLDDRINQCPGVRFSASHLPCRSMGLRAFHELTRISVDGRPEGPETIVLPVSFVDNGSIRTLSR